MAELVEAVSRAIRAVEGDAWDGSVTPNMLARAALAAIEPTLQELGKYPEKYGYAAVYSQGWHDALGTLLIEIDKSRQPAP